jgi:hypothetical protein
MSLKFMDFSRDSGNEKENVIHSKSNFGIDSITRNKSSRKNIGGM